MGMDSLQEYIAAITLFISNVLLPLFFALALLFFLWNTVKYFIIGAGEKDAKDKARQLALYGIGAFVFLVSLWGLVNLLVNGLQIGDGEYVRPDYFDHCGTSGSSAGSCM